MRNPVVDTMLDTMLIMFPFICIMVIWMLRLDERVYSKKPRTLQRKRRGFCGPDKDGEQQFSDPDGSRSI
jgi:hypothetical protein